MHLITPSQCRAARALLNWSQPTLAEKCNLHVQTISNFEKDKKIPSKKTLETIGSIFENNNITFGEDDGVQRASNKVSVYKNCEGFIKFRQDVLKNAQSGFLDIFVSNVDERLFNKWGNDTINNYYRSEMRKIKNLNFRIIIKEGDTHTTASYAQYRWAKMCDFESIPIYIYGTKTAILPFQENELNIFVIDHPLIAKFFKSQFDQKWERALPFN